MTAIDWAAGLARAGKQYPSTAERDWSEALRDYDLMGNLIRDILALAGSGQRRGRRTQPTEATHLHRVRQMIDGADDWTVLPFADAVRLTWPHDAAGAIAERVGTDPRFLLATLNGATPSPALLEATAAAMGRRPVYFREYRAHLIVTFLAQHFDRVPEASVALATYLDRRTSRSA